MMARALVRFTVGYGAVRVRVRLLPTSRDVDAEYRGGRRRRGGDWIHAFFEPAGSGAAHVGTIVLPADGRLAELVPHEVTHAVMHRLDAVRAVADERLATAVGLLSARIFDRLREIAL